MILRTFSVVPAGPFWAVKSPGRTIPLSKHTSKDDGIDAAIRYARALLPSLVLICNAAGNPEIEYTYCEGAPLPAA